MPTCLQELGFGYDACPNGLSLDGRPSGLIPTRLPTMRPPRWPRAGSDGIFSGGKGSTLLFLFLVFTSVGRRKRRRTGEPFLK